MPRKKHPPVNTQNQVDKLPTEPKLYRAPVRNAPGFFVSVTPTGAKSYLAVATDPRDGKQKWATLGPVSNHTLDVARRLAAKAITRIKNGLPPFEAPPEKPDSFGQVAKRYMEREAKNFRTRDNYQRMLDNHVLPRWKDRAFRSITREDVTALLDAVEDGSGARMADTVRTTLGLIMRWQESRLNDYVPPLSSKMRRDKSKPRHRFLNPEEIRLVWDTAGGCGTFGALVKFGLLTGQRQGILATAKRDDISVDGTWTIPDQGERAKSDGGTLVLPEVALEVVRGQTRVEDNPHIFPALRGAGPFSGFSKAKPRLDRTISQHLRGSAEQRGENADKVQPLEGWRFHDLRRTASTFMSRAGVDSFHVERTLGHEIGGAEGIYNRHDFKPEKRQALAVLARYMKVILDKAVFDAVETYLAAEPKGDEKSPLVVFHAAIAAGGTEWKTFIDNVISPGENVVEIKSA